MPLHYNYKYKIIRIENIRLVSVFKYKVTLGILLLHLLLRDLPLTPACYRLFTGRLASTSLAIVGILPFGPLFDRVGVYVKLINGELRYHVLLERVLKASDY